MPAHNECRFREEWRVSGCSCIARHPSALPHGIGEKPSAIEASCPPDRQHAGSVVVRSRRDVGRALPQRGRIHPVEGSLGGSRGVVKR